MTYVEKTGENQAVTVEDGLDRRAPLGQLPGRGRGRPDGEGEEGSPRHRRRCRSGALARCGSRRNGPSGGHGDLEAGDGSCARGAAGEAGSSERDRDATGASLAGSGATGLASRGEGSRRPRRRRGGGGRGGRADRGGDVRGGRPPEGATQRASPSSRGWSSESTVPFGEETSGPAPSAGVRRECRARYSPEVVEFFKATGEGWQARMDRPHREQLLAAGELRLPACSAQGHHRVELLFVEAAARRGPPAPRLRSPRPRRRSGA